MVKHITVLCHATVSPQGQTEIPEAATLKFYCQKDSTLSMDKTFNMWKELCENNKLSYEDLPTRTEACDSYMWTKENNQIDGTYSCSLDYDVGVWEHTGANGQYQVPDWDLNNDEQVVQRANDGTLTLNYLIDQSYDHLGLNKGQNVVIHCLMCREQSNRRVWGDPPKENSDIKTEEGQIKETSPGLDGKEEQEEKGSENTLQSRLKKFERDLEEKGLADGKRWANILYEEFGIVTTAILPELKQEQFKIITDKGYIKNLNDEVVLKSITGYNENQENLTREKQAKIDKKVADEKAKKTAKEAETKGKKKDEKTKREQDLKQFADKHLQSNKDHETE